MTKSQIHTRLLSLKQTIEIFDPSQAVKEVIVEELQNIISSLEK